MKLAQWIGGAVAAAIVGTAVAFAAPAVAAGPATPAPTPTATATAGADSGWSGLCLGQKVRLVWSKAPDQLKTDLEAARKLGPGDDRRNALAAIRTAALAGDYGTDVQTFAQKRQDAWVDAWQNAPTDLKSDLKALRAQSPGQDRRDAAKQLFDKALAGQYGTAAQARAEKWEECFAAK